MLILPFIGRAVKARVRLQKYVSLAESSLGAYAVSTKSHVYLNASWGFLTSLYPNQPAKLQRLAGSQISCVASFDMILSNKQISKALIRAQARLRLSCSQTPKTGFLRSRHL